MTAPPTLAAVSYGGSNVTGIANTNVVASGNKKRVVIMPGNIKARLNGTYYAGSLGADPAPGVPKSSVINWSCPSGPGTAVRNVSDDWQDVSSAGAPASSGGGGSCANPEQDYLTRYPDVAANVASGVGFKCGYHHWVTGGYAEGRMSCWPMPTAGTSDVCGTAPYIKSSPGLA